MLWTVKGRDQGGALIDRPRGRVLVVEDDPTTRMFLEDALEYEGYAVRTAADGADGLATMRQWRPDAIVLDVNMPNVDAPVFRAVQFDSAEVADVRHVHVDAPVFRAVQFDSAEVADVPVLLLSATPAAVLERIANDLGAAAWLTKPCDVSALAAAVGRLAAR